VALYKTSWATYQIARRMAKVQYVAMPNLLAERLVFPEFIQEAATPDNLAQAGLMLLEDLERRKAIKRELADLVKGLGSPGAVARAADAIASLVRDGAHPFPLRAHLRS
jgi:lipid-A-disaccharide synthase